MAEAAVVTADAAVAKAQAAFDGTVGDNTLCGQLLLAEKNVLLGKENSLAQLKEERLRYNCELQQVATVSSV